MKAVDFKPRCRSSLAPGSFSRKVACISLEHISASCKLCSLCCYLWLA